MLFRSPVLFIAGLLICLGCSSEPTATETTDTPEQVARAWQNFIDNNEFDKAKSISTVKTQKLIEMMEAILFEDEEETALPPTNFLEMKCAERQDTASCVYIIDADGEQVKDSFLLIRTNGQWLVDVAEEDPSINEEDAAEMFENFEKRMNSSVEGGDTSLINEE